ncbi:MAG TPA: hypothetical protein VGM09_26530 [Bradyrhizobium sp.]|jgi:hypothetical protein
MTLFVLSDQDAEADAPPSGRLSSKADGSRAIPRRCWRRASEDIKARYAKLFKV